MKRDFWKGLGVGVALVVAAFILWGAAWTSGRDAGVYSMQSDAVYRGYGYWGLKVGDVGSRFFWKTP